MIFCHLAAASSRASWGDFLPRTAAATASSNAARYSAPAGQAQRAEPLLVTQCGLGRVGVLHCGGGRNRLLDPLAGRFQVRLAEQRRGRTGRADLRTHLAVGEPEQQLERRIGVGRVLADHAQPAGDRQQRDAWVFVVGPLLPDVAAEVENAARAGEFDEADAERGEGGER